jgi:hypothetical protein
MTTPYLHAIEGRARVKIPGIKGSPARARDLERRLSLCAGVRTVKANPTTGNALILYEEAVISLDAIQGRISDWVSQHGLASHVHAREPVSGSLRGKVVASVWATATEIALKRLLFA